MSIGNASSEYFAQQDFISLMSVYAMSMGESKILSGLWSFRFMCSMQCEIHRQICKYLLVVHTLAMNNNGSLHVYGVSLRKIHKRNDAVVNGMRSGHQSNVISNFYSHYQRRPLAITIYSHSHTRSIKTNRCMWHVNDTSNLILFLLKTIRQILASIGLCADRLYWICLANRYIELAINRFVE